MAELGMLKHVESISTVSGGSIVGAAYYLLLKELLERKEKLSRLMERNILSRTNAHQVMGILEEYIELKALFDKD